MKHEFTLVEIMLVIIIMGIIAAVTVPKIMELKDKKDLVYVVKIGQQEFRCTGHLKESTGIIKCDDGRILKGEFYTE